MAVTQKIEPDREISDQCGEQDRLAQVQLQSRLRCQFGFSASEIRARCSEGNLVLDGHVDSFHKKQMAQELARHVFGVRSVVNRLVVDSSRLNRRVQETFRTATDHVFH